MTIPLPATNSSGRKRTSTQRGQNDGSQGTASHCRPYHKIGVLRRLGAGEAQLKIMFSKTFIAVCTTSTHTISASVYDMMPNSLRVLMISIWAWCTVFWVDVNMLMTSPGKMVDSEAFVVNRTAWGSRSDLLGSHIRDGGAWWSKRTSSG